MLKLFNKISILKKSALVAVVFSAVFFLSYFAEAALVGPNNPGTIVDDISVGTITWSTPSNAASSNNSYAKASLNDNIISHYLKATNFGFSIPTSAVIDGITVEIEKKASNASRIQDYSVRIVKGGVIGSTDKSNSSFWGTSDAYTTYGSLTELWGETWTADDINSANFGLAFSGFKNSTAGGAVTASVDHIRITVTYTVNTAPNTPTLVSPANATYTNDTTPTLSANYSDPDSGDTGTTNYRIATSSANCTSGIIVASGASVETSSNNQNTTWTPGSSIGSDRTYFWCAQNNDGVLTTAWTSMGNFILDTTAPTISIGSPSVASTRTGPVTYTVTYTGADSVTLANGNVTLNTTGTANGSVNVTGSGTSTRTVTISSITGDGTLGISIAAGTASDTAGNTAASAGPSVTFIVDNTVPTISFTDNVELGPVASDTISATWGDASVKKWDYDTDGVCSTSAGSYTKTDSDSMNQTTETNNGKYICLYGEDSLGNKSTLASANNINIDSTGPTLSFTDNVEAGPVASDTISATWGDATVKKWDYDTDGVCSTTAGDYTKTDSDSMNQTTDTNNGKYICLYAEDSLGNKSTLASTNVINISTAAKFVIVSAPDGTIDSPSLVTIQAQNSGGGLISTYQQNVTLVTTGSAIGAGLIDIINGVGTTTISDEVVETVHLSLSDSEGTGLNVSSTRDVYFGPGATAKLFTSASTSEMIAGTLLPITISRKDRLNNLITAGSETFYLYSNSLSSFKKFYNASSGGDIVETVLISNGSSESTVWYYDDKAGVPTITVSDKSTAPPDGDVGIDDASVSITVTSAPASALFISDKTDLTAGERLEYELSRQDQFGNTSDNGTLRVYLYDTSASPATSTAFYNVSSGGTNISYIDMSSGVTTVSFWLYADKAGSVSLTASDNSSNPDGATGVVDASDSLTINPGSVAIFALNNPGTMTISTRLGYTVSRYDAYNNPVSTGDNTVYLYHDALGTSTVFYNSASDGGIINSLIIAAGNMFNNFWFYSDDTGDYNITASDNSLAPDGNDGIDDSTDLVTVSPLPIVATRFVIGDTATTTAGETVSVNVRAEDDLGNLDTSYNNSVILHTSGSATPGGLVNLVAGVGSINIIDTKAETVTLTLENTASSSLDVSSTKYINFVAGPTDKFTMTGSGSAVAGERVEYSINRQDQYDNDVSVGSDNIYLYSNATVGTAHFYNAYIDGSQILSTSILSGSNSTNVWFAGTRAGNWTVDASDNSETPDGGVGIIDATSSISIVPAATARLTLNDPGDITAGTRVGYTGTRYDTYNNEVTAGSASYYLYSNSTGTSTAFYLTDSSSLPVTTVNFSDGNSTAEFWYYDDQIGIWTIYLSDNSSSHDGAIGIVDGEDGVTVSPVPIVATKFIIALTDDSVLVNTPVTVTVRAVNNNNDIDTTYQNDVTLHVSGSATGGGKVDIIDGVGQITINDSTEETVQLSLSDTEGTDLNVSFTTSIIFSKVAVITGSTRRVASAVITPSVSFTGRAFPSANIEIMAIQDGKVPVSGLSTGSAGGGFSANFTGQLPSTVSSFALVVYDKDHNIAQTKIFKLGVNDQLAKDILMSPTVSLKTEAVSKGTFLGITGSAMPNYKIQLMVDGVKATETATADGSGNYDLAFNTYRLSLGNHTLKVRQVDSQGKVSDYSIEKTFLITKTFVSKADLNGDGIVDIKDWSIFMARYRSTDTNIRQNIDLNDDEKIDATDLSLFINALSK